MRVLAAFLLAATACHIDMAPLPQNPTPDQRMQTWQVLHAIDEEDVITCTNKGCSETKYVLLANGESTKFAEDLLPVVRADSPTAQHAARALSHRRMGTLFGLVGAGLIIGGMVTGISELAGENGNQALGKTELAIGLGGGLASAIIGWYYMFLGRQETTLAFRNFNKDLGDNLHLCGVPNHVVPCELAPGGPAGPGGAPGQNMPPLAPDPTAAPLGLVGHRANLSMR